MIKDRSALLKSFMHIGPDVLCCTKICCPWSTVILSKRGFFFHYPSPVLLITISIYFWTSLRCEQLLNDTVKTCTCYCFSKMKWPLVTAGVTCTQNGNLNRLDILQNPVIWKHVHPVTWGEHITVTCHCNLVCFKFQLIWSFSEFLYVHIHDRDCKGLCCFVLGLITLTVKQLSLGYICDLLLCIFESFSFRQVFFFSIHVTRVEHDCDVS